MRLTPRTKTQIFWNLFWSAPIGCVAWLSVGPEGTDLFAFLVLFVFNLALLYYVACVVASTRMGIPVPQTLIDPHGVAEVGLFGFRFEPWSGLSDMIVFEERGEYSSYHLMAFAKGQPMPVSEKNKKRMAKMRLSLPGLRNETHDTMEVYSEYCCFINAWRRYEFDSGQALGPASLEKVAERVDVSALSENELKASWRAICARY